VRTRHLAGAVALTLFCGSIVPETAPAEATGVRIVSPANGAVVRAPFTLAVQSSASHVTLEISGVVVRRVATADVPQLGHGAIFGDLPLKPGPNDVRVIADLVGAPYARETLYASGPPVRFVFEQSTKTISASGAPVAMRLRGVDGWGNPASATSVVDITVANGTGLLRMPNAEAQTGPRLEGPLDDTGSVAFLFVPGLQSGTVSLVASSPDLPQVQPATHDFFVRPGRRAPVVVGVAGLGAGPVAGDVDGSGVFDNGGSRRARLGLFGTGSVGGQTVAAFSYETANRLSAAYPFSTYQSDPNTRSYLTYGDSSTRESDALSLTHLYARVDSGRNSLMYGEFAPDPSGTQGAGSVQGLLSGVQLHLEDNGSHVAATGYTANDAIAFGRTTFNPLGLAIGVTLRPNLIVGSDTLTLVALDRRTGAVLTQQILVRNVDYAIDYATGAIRFINVPLPYDAHFDPQVVLATYEYDGVTGGAKTSGGNARATLGPTTLRLGYLEDTGLAAPYSLFSQALDVKSAGGTLTIERDDSRNGAGLSLPGVVTNANGGTAYHVAFDYGGATDRFSGAFDATDAGFGNPYGGFVTPGLQTYDLRYSHNVKKTGSFALAYDAQNQLGASPYRQQRASAALDDPLTQRFRLHLAVQQLTQSAFTQGPLTVPQNYGIPFTGAVTPALVTPAGSFQAGTTTQGIVGLDWSAARNVDLSVQRTASFGGVQNATSPSQTTAQASYRMHGGRAYVEELWNNQPQYSFAQSTAGYGGFAQARHQAIAGVDLDLSKQTSLTTQYVVDDTLAGTDAYAAYGVKQRFTLGPLMHGDAFVQTASDLGLAAQQGSSRFGLYGFDLAYDKQRRVSASVAFQDRTGYLGGTSLSSGISGRLSSEMSVSGTYEGTTLDGFTLHDARLGLAWRPSGNDRGAALLALDQYSSSVTGAGTHDDVLSYDQLYRPGGRRAIQRIGGRFDIGSEVQTLSFTQVTGANQTTYASELGFRVNDRLRLAAGYNFSGSVDPALVGQPVRRGVYATVTSVIDNLFGWGARR
jgi:hypothetical protein